MAPEDACSIRQRRCRDHGRIAAKEDASEEMNRDGIQGFDQAAQDWTSSYTTLFPNPETSEHRSSTLRNNPLSGITFPRLFRLVIFEKFHSVDWWRYKARIACLFLVSLLNSFLEIIESIYIYCWLRPIFRHVTSTSDQQQQPPLFVLGHPRTGTTLLHSLLAQDTDRFATCTTFCAGFPHAFLWFEDLGKVLFSSILSETRPMDNMRLHFDLPQEDELATCLLTGGMYSPYMSLYFMRDEREYRPFQTFRDAAPEEVSQWGKAFQWLCTKLTVRSVLGQIKARQWRDRSLLPAAKRLVLKSPCHTGRIRHLLRLFPKAQFVYVHRHPLEVFLSSVHMANTTYAYMYLQRPNDGDLKEYILKQGEILVEEYVSCVDDGVDGQLIKGKNLVEVSFEDLTANPYDAVKLIYDGLEGLKNVFAEAADSSTSRDSFPTKLKDYCKSLEGYQKNSFSSRLLDNEVVEEVRLRWRIQFERYGYHLYE